MLKSYGWWWGGGGGPFGLDFGTLDFGTSDSGLTICQILLLGSVCRYVTLFYLKLIMKRLSFLKTLFSCFGSKRNGC